MAKEVLFETPGEFTRKLPDVIDMIIVIEYDYYNNRERRIKKK
jgi:hypothetical protein